MRKGRGLVPGSDVAMAEPYVRPGNKQRGWNDPPQFSYGLQTQGGGPKRPLTRRVPAHGAPSPGSSKLGSSGCTSSPAPKACGAAPLAGLSPALRPDATRQAVSPAEEECEVDVEEVLGPLAGTLSECRSTVQKQVCEDISRRLAVLRALWLQGKLSAPVRKRMTILVQELQQRHWDAADDIHRSLMVDHVQEVSQWLVGIKRLIAEARHLPQEDLAAAEEQTAEEAP